jgi:Flp pilus assembly pilin Flp
VLEETSSCSIAVVIADGAITVKGSIGSRFRKKGRRMVGM